MMRITLKQSLQGVLFACAALILIVMPSPLVPPVGEGDFRGYWSASYLLAHGENFSDSVRLLQVERAQADWRGDYAIITCHNNFKPYFLYPLTLV